MAAISPRLLCCEVSRPAGRDVDLLSPSSFNVKPRCFQATAKMKGLTSLSQYFGKGSVYHKCFTYTWRKLAAAWWCCVCVCVGFGSSVMWRQNPDVLTRVHMHTYTFPHTLFSSINHGIFGSFGGGSEKPFPPQTTPPTRAHPTLRLLVHSSLLFQD